MHPLAAASRSRASQVNSVLPSGKLSIHSLNIAGAIAEVAKSFEAGFASKNIQ